MLLGKVIRNNLISVIFQKDFELILKIRDGIGKFSGKIGCPVWFHLMRFFFFSLVIF